MISVPISNPVRFRPLTGQTDVNFDNTFASEWNGLKKPFNQIVAPDDWTIQVVSDTNYYDEETVSSDLAIYLQYSDGDTEYLPDVPIVTELDGLYYYNFNIRPSFTGCFQMVVQIYSTETDYFRSEWCITEAGYIDGLREDNPDVRKLEWFNHENAFAANYVQSGFVGLAYLESKMYLQAPAGDSIVFDNQGDDVKLKEVIQRVFKFTCEVPDYLCEILSVAMAHDRFFINDVEYVTNKKPALTQLSPRSNMYLYEAEVKQVTAIGLNTHDTGFDCDALTTEVIVNITETGATASFTQEMPAGYLLHVVTINRTSGSATVECGTTEGDDDIFAAVTVDGTDTTALVECHHNFPAATTIYFTVTGTVNITLNSQLIKNAEE